MSNNMLKFIADLETACFQVVYYLLRTLWIYIQLDCLRLEAVHNGSQFNDYAAKE